MVDSCGGLVDSLGKNPPPRFSLIYQSFLLYIFFLMDGMDSYINKIVQKKYVYVYIESFQKRDKTHNTIHQVYRFTNF